ncbi:hypothetical protein M9Y10_013932 [Tritrichomonas musculus]|uniref:USP domain-containing protein n=1 Tax=Tritrichomonas musculus TaxID=1915356 RepID=A0ABR2KY82_9EUKA
MEPNYFGNFQENSIFIDSLSKLNNYLNYYFENSRFPDENFELSFLITQILPILTKSTSSHIQEKKITDNQFFQQIKILIGFYIKIIQADNIYVSSFLLQILTSIYISFPDFLKNDIYNLCDILTLNIITDFYQLILTTTDYVDIYILILLLILIQNENIGSIEDQEFLPNFITKFDQCVNSFNYDKVDPALFIQIFWVFDQIIPTFPYFSNNNTDNSNFFNAFLNFSIKSLQSSQSIEKQKASIRFISSSLKNEKYKIELKSDRKNNDSNQDQFNEAAFNYTDYNAKSNTDSIDNNSKSDSLEIIHNFDIDEENVLKNPLFVRWSQKFKPLSALINVEGHMDTLQEVDILIQQICKIYWDTDTIIDQITSEILCQIASRVESADNSQKKIFIHEFASIFSFLCDTSGQIAIEFLQKVDQDIQKKFNTETIEEEEEENDSFPNVIVSNSTLVELGKGLIPNKIVFGYIIKMFESQIFDHNDPSAIPYIIQLIKGLKLFTNTQLTHCLDILKSTREPPQIIYEMLTSLVTILSRDEIYKLFSELILLSETIKDDKFRSLLEKVTIKCKTQPNKREATLLIQEFCLDDDGWRAILNIFNHRKIVLFKPSGWRFLIEILCQSKMTAMSLDFLRTIFPDLLNLLKYEEKNTHLYNEIFSHLMDDYIQFENYQSFETFIQIETFLHPINKQYMYAMLFSTKLAEMNQIDNLDRFFDFLRMIIEHKEWNMNFASFEDINQFGIKIFKRLKKLKKPKNAFTIHVSVQPPDASKAEIHYIDVCPDTTLADIIVYLAVGIGISSDLSIHSLDENCYCYYENMRTDDMYTELSDWDTVGDLGITEETDLRMFYRFNGATFCNYNNYFPSEILSKNSLKNTLVGIINQNDDTKLIKSAWKLYCLLVPDYSLSNQMILQAKSLYSKLYFLKILSYHYNERPEALRNPQSITTLAIIVDLIIRDKLDNKLLNAALATLTFEEAAITISNGGVPLLNILIDSFVNSTKNTLNERILTVMNLAHKTHRINEFDSIVINNENFLKKCIILNSLKSFKKKDIIQKFFDTFESNSKKILFDFFSKSFLETNENCFTFLKATFTNECEVTTLFEKSLKNFIECTDDNTDEQYVKDLALFIDFILTKRTELIDQTADVCTQLISKAFEEMNNDRQSLIFKILLHYVKGNKSNQNAINALIHSFNSFESTRWNYDPSVHKKKSNFCGLRSLGMTCYMNSILQQLAYNKMFRNSLFRLDSSNTNSIASELQKVVAHLELSNRSFADTEKFTSEWKQKGFPRFDPRVQEDVVEFFHCLLDHLPDDLKKMFTGEQVNIFEGLNVSFRKTVSEPFSSIEIPVSTTFSEGMKSVSSTTMFVGNNKYTSEEFGKIDVSMKTKIVKFPNTFVIQLKRFDFSLKSGVRTKISRSFSFPLKFNTSEIFEDESQPNIEYVLQGVVAHAGTAEGGHYNSIIKIDGSWVLFNDTEVETLTDSQFTSLTKGGSKKNSLQSCAYVLFYVVCDPQTHQVIMNSISNNNNNNVVVVDDDVPVPSCLVDEVNEENEAFKKMQCIFTPGLASFAMQTQNIDIILPYFLNVFSHSAMLKSSSQTTQKINAMLKDNNEKGFDFFFDNTISSENDTLKNGENLTKTIDIILNGQDELVQPFVFLLRHLIQEKSKIYVNKVESKLKNDQNILFLALKKAKENAGSWKNLERFGYLISAFVDNYKNLISDQQTKTHICLQIMDIITTFYDITTSEFSLKQIDFSNYFTSLVILNNSIENIEVFDSFINKVNPKLIPSSVNSQSFQQLFSVVSNRKEKNKTTIKKLSKIQNEKESESENEELEFEYDDTYCDDDLGPFNFTSFKKKISLVTRQTAKLLAQYAQSFNKNVNIIGVLDSIADNDSESLISLLTSTNFNFFLIYQYFVYPDYAQEKNYFCQILYRKPLILSRLFIIGDFYSLFDQLFHFVFPYISFVGDISSTIMDQSMVLRSYKYIVDTFTMYIRMKDYPWMFSDLSQIFYRINFFYHAIKNYLTPDQINKIYDLNERLFLSFTSYVDIHDDNHVVTNDPYIINARERRKLPSRNASLSFIFFVIYDVKQRISLFEKYSKYFIRYCTSLPIKDGQDLDFAIITIFREAFIKKPVLFLRLLKSEEIIYPLKNSPKSHEFVKLMASLAKDRSVCDYVLFILMPKVPLTAILNGSFLRIAVDNAEHLAEHPEKALKLVSLFIDEFFMNIDQIMKKNRFFSLMNDISKMVQVIGSKSDRKIDVFILAEKAKDKFVENFLNVINQDSFNNDASKFVTSLSAQNEEFANFLLTILISILKSQNKEPLKIGEVTIKSDVLSVINCWKLISMVIEFSKDIENSIIPVVDLIIHSSFTSDEENDQQLNEYYQICIEKFALFVNNSNVEKFRPLFDAILSSSIQISENILPFLIQVIKQLDEDEKANLILGTAVFMSDPEDKERFIRTFKVVVALLQNMKDVNSILDELNQTYPEIMELQDMWPEECNQQKFLFQPH